MQHFKLFSIAVLWLTLSPLLAADKPAVTGWRGDGTGIYPDATPPMSWGRVGPVLKGLRCQASKPKSDAESGSSIAFGIITDWLVLGPFDVKDHAHPLDGEFIEKESEIQPDEGETVGSLQWKPIKVENHFADFDAVLGNAADKAAYAHSYIFSPIDGQLHLRTWSNYSGKKVSDHKIWINGKPVDRNGCSFAVKKGWNRILLKICKLDTTAQFFFKCELRSVEPCAYESHNIAWSVPIPFSASSPITVGEKIFVCYEPYYLACFNKTDGKLLWIRSNGYHDAADPSARAGHPEFDEAAKLASKIENMDTALFKSAPSTKAPKERDELLKSIEKLMLTVDPVKHKPNPEQVGNAGYAGMTPCSDGKFVYAWFGTGITACYDLDGNRQWIHLENRGWSHHGYASSPLLVDGKVIVYMRGLQALDCKTGAVVWEQTWKAECLCLFGSFAKATVGFQTVLVSPVGTCVVNASDGKLIFGQAPTGCGICTPVADNGIVYRMEQLGPLQRLELSADGQSGVSVKPLKPIDISPTQFPSLHMSKHNFASTPVCYEGLLYFVDAEGDLIVFDTKTEAIVYQRKLDINALFCYNGWPHVAGICASLVIAGKHLYIQGNLGVTLIVQPGRDFKLLAKNKIEDTGLRGTWDERQEATVCTPIFDGNRMFLRAENNLYCISEK